MDNAHDPTPYLMRYTGQLCQPLPRYDYRAEWMKQGQVIPLAGRHHG